jgi:hypothetical protein
MKYKHCRVLEVTGYVLPEGVSELILWRDEASDSTLLVTSELDERVVQYDRRMAIASLSLSAMIGGVEIPPNGRKHFERVCIYRPRSAQTPICAGQRDVQRRHTNLVNHGNERTPKS